MTCGSGLARDGSYAVTLIHRAACIAMQARCHKIKVKLEVSC